MTTQPQEARMDSVAEDYSQAERLILRLIYGPMIDKAVRVSVPAVLNFSHAVAAVEAALALALAEREGERAEIARLREALKWALPLAERAVDDHRMLRLQCGHSDINGTYKNGQTWAGIHQNEVDQIEAARVTLAGQQ